MMGVSVDWDRACFTMDPVGELLFVCLFVCLFYIVRQYTTCPLLGDYIGIFDF